MKWDLVFNPYFSPRVTAVFFVLLAASLAGSWRANRRLERVALAYGLSVLRAVSLGLLCLLLLGPSLEIKKAQEIPGAFALLVDQSASMSLSTKQGARFQVVQQALRQSKSALNDMAQTASLHYFTFGAEVKETNLAVLLDEKTQAELPQTNLLHALEQVRERLHVCDADGNMHIGIDAFIYLWQQTTKQRWLAYCVRLPIIYQLSRLIYNGFAKGLYVWNRALKHW